MDKHYFVVFWFIYSIKKDTNTYLSKTETIKMRLVEMIETYKNYR